MCDGCHLGGNVNCIKCKYVKQDGACRRSCMNMFYPDGNKECQQCHEECRGGCHGPSQIECNACNNFKVYLDKESWNGQKENCTDADYICRPFNCTHTCPTELPFTEKDQALEGEGTTVCVDESHPIVARRLTQKRNDDKRFVSRHFCKEIVWIQ